jgi:hypothetical protein
MKTFKTPEAYRTVSKLIVMGLGLTLVCSYNACSPGGLSGTSDSAAQLGSSQSAGVAQVKMSMAVLDSANNVVYSDSDPTGTLTIKTGSNYTINLNPKSTPVAGTTVNLVIYPYVPTAGATATALMTIPLQFGANALPTTLPIGSYSLVLVETAPNMQTVTQPYTASVTCQNPTFSTAAGTTVTIGATSEQNVFNYTVNLGAVNGMAGYQCAIDPTGTTILDTAFQSCSSAFTNVYSNLVGSRKVNIAIKDACGIAVTTSAQVNLPYSEPTMGTGVNFIYGTTSNPGGEAANGFLTSAGLGPDPRDYPVTYLATNDVITTSSMTNTAVGQSSYVVQGNYDYNNQGAFSINSSMTYGMAASQSFGIGLQITGITGSVNWTTGASGLSAAAATITSVGYSTDAAGDAFANQSFIGTTCTLSQQGITAHLVTGTPCTDTNGDGLVHTNNQVTVEMWGHYVCTGLVTTDGSSSLNLSGDFDGLKTIQDSCIGGGGQGSGGVTTYTN